MGGRGKRRPGNQAGTSPGLGRNDRAITLREEMTGKFGQSWGQKWNKNSYNKGVSVKATDMLRIEHMEFCALWAARDAKIPSLAALYGRNLASARESLGLPPNPALFQCERCETILQRDVNCTVRARKNKGKAQEALSRKPSTPAPNYVVYRCHFCSHGNVKKENPRKRTTETCPSIMETTQISTVTELDPVGAEKVVEVRNEANARHELALPQMPAVSSKIPTTGGLASRISASESDSLEPAGAEKVVGGRVEVNTMHDQLTTNCIATPEVRIQNAKEPCLPETKMTPNRTFLESSYSKPVVLEEINVNESKDGANEIDKSEVPSTPPVSAEIDNADVPARPRLTLLDTNKRKRKKATAKKPVGPENDSGTPEEEKSIGKSSRRKRKSWTTLKEIADNIEQDKQQKFLNLLNSPNPFSR